MILNLQDIFLICWILIGRAQRRGLRHHGVMRPFIAQSKCKGHFVPQPASRPCWDVDPAIVCVCVAGREKQASGTVAARGAAERLSWHSRAASCFVSSLHSLSNPFLFCVWQGEKSKRVALSLHVARLNGPAGADGLHAGAVVPAAVKAVEDHGYSLTFGIKVSFVHQGGCLRCMKLEII